MRFSRPAYWSGFLFPSPGNLSNPGIKPRSPALQADSLPTEPPGDSPGKNTGVGCHALLQGISQPKDQTHVSYISYTGRQTLYY